jgi:hypothetical protein
MRPLLIAALCLAAAACTRDDTSRLSHDVKAVGQDVAVATKHATEDPAVRHAGDELKSAGEHADKALESAAEKAKSSVHEATADNHDDRDNRDSPAN